MASFQSYSHGPNPIILKSEKTNFNGIIRFKIFINKYKLVKLPFARIKLLEHVNCSNWVCEELDADGGPHE